MDNFCVDCGKKISDTAKRCRSCAPKKRKPRSVYRHPPKYCVNCGIKIGYTSTRCVSCAAKDPERCKKVAIAIAEHWALGLHVNNHSPEANEKRRAAWTPELKEETLRKWRQHYQNHPEMYRWTEETRQKVEDSHTEEWRKRHGELMRQAWTPQRRAEQAERMRNMPQSQRDSIGDASRERWQDPVKRAIHVANMIDAWTDEKRRNQSERMAGENNPTWQGGQSEYDVNFTEEFRILIRLRDNYTCAICGEPGKDVHHIDYNKENTILDNCITLCKSCHSRTNCNRRYWEQVCEGLVKRSK